MGAKAFQKKVWEVYATLGTKGLRRDSTTKYSIQAPKLGMH